MEISHIECLGTSVNHIPAPKIYLWHIDGNHATHKKNTETSLYYLKT